MLTVLEAAELLRRFDHVLILTHVRPDGDTVGCAAALCAALRALGKTAYLLPDGQYRPLFCPLCRAGGLCAGAGGVGGHRHHGAAAG